MSNYVSLEEASKRLGITADELVEMRSRGEIFGFRDGASWKFKPEEIDRVRLELSGDILDEEAGGSSILVSENQIGPSGSKSGSTIGADGRGTKPDSDLKLSDDIEEGSDVALIPDPSSGSGVRLVNRNAPAPDDDDVLELADDDDDSVEIGSGSLLGSDISDIDLGSDLKIDIGSGSDAPISTTTNRHGSDVLAGSDVRLKSGSSDGGDVVRGDSDPSISGSGSLGLGGELAISDEDDLVLGSGSDLGLAADSGINLMSPSDSGLSLEDEPLDLAGTGISGLDLAGEGSDPGGSGSGISGSGSLVDFQQDEEFQLSPSGGIEAEEDSGSQVIELEDSTDFGDAVGGLPGDDGMLGGEFGSDQADGSLGVESGMAGAAMMQGTPEVPMGIFPVTALLVTLLTCGMSAIFVTDIVRNMWEWNSSSDLTSWFTNLVMSSLGLGKS